MCYGAANKIITRPSCVSIYRQAKVQALFISSCMHEEADNEASAMCMTQQEVRSILAVSKEGSSGATAQIQESCAG